MCRRPVDGAGRATFNGGVGRPCEKCGGRRRKISAATRHLVRYQKGDPRAREAGRKGAEVTNGRRRERSWLADMLADRLLQRADVILATYFRVLEWQPDSTWSQQDVQHLRLFQVHVAELLLDRTDGKPVA
ncbi:MAG: hypothetical protein QOJ13_964 [Gaiellales bacterium]|jgi:hypothetical protein|nr:hypothetical protein [Gaiellales bacterium]